MVTWCQTKYCEFIAPLLPAAPAELEAFVDSSNRVKLSWSDPGGNEEGFLVERKMNDQYSILDTIDTNTLDFTDSTVLAETTYSYRLRAYNAAGFSGYSNEVSVTTGTIDVTSLHPGQITALGLIIYPNPFMGTARITFTLPVDCLVSLKVFDHSGREVRALLHKRMPAGTHTSFMDGAGLPGGAYYCRLKAGSSIEARKIILF
jgi:hypothetical protein